MCKCGQSEQTVQHMLQCQLLDKPCSIQDLADAMETAMMCVNKWKKRSEEKQLMMDSTRRPDVTCTGKNGKGASMDPAP